VSLLRPYRGKSTFTATLAEDGVFVDNLERHPFLPWGAFRETVRLLVGNGGRARRGVYTAQLGSPELSLDSVEGHVAYMNYGKLLGMRVVSRVTSIGGILIWVGMCEVAPRELVLRDFAWREWVGVRLWRSWRSTGTGVVRPEIGAEVEREVREWVVRSL
jgi:hypothetical protein